MRPLFAPRFHPARLLCSTGVEIALAVAAVASTAVTVAGSIAQGNAAAGAAARQADMQRMAAAAEEQQGVVAKQLQDRQNAIDRGKTVAAFAGAGVDLSEGTPLELLSQQAANGEYKSEVAKFQHDQRAWLLRVGATNSDAAGAAAESTATGNAIGAGLKGAAQLGVVGAKAFDTPSPVSDTGPTGQSVATELAQGTRPV